MKLITLLWSGPGLYWPRWAGPKVVLWARNDHDDAIACVRLGSLAMARKITSQIIGA